MADSLVRREIFLSPLTIDIVEPHVITKSVEELVPERCPGVPGAPSHQIIDQPELRNVSFNLQWRQELYEQAQAVKNQNKAKEVGDVEDGLHQNVSPRKFSFS